ncbi:ABC transporter ATP-binding protein [Nonomuraea sp. JJY05]|jgi:ATP-binding cassette subfamily B protein|uniref:ABC transporter ATP-binding protein n=1 Tax=Nonomuraea sp. JJY05 TaxID=3350255 RepID=UPI00373FBFC2
MRERLDLLRLFRYAGPAVTIALVVMVLIDAVVPAGIALAVQELVAADGRSALAPVLLMSGVVLAGQMALAFRFPVGRLAADRIDGAHRTRIAALVMGVPTVDVAERQDVQDRVKTTTAEPRDWVDRTSGDGAVSQLELVGHAVGLAASSVVLSWWSWWLVPATVIPAVFFRMVHGRQWVRHFRIWVEGVLYHRRWKYWGEVATTPAAGRELRVFGASEWLLGHYTRDMRTHVDPVWEDDRRVLRGLWLALFLPLAGCAVAFTWVALGTAAGQGSIALEVAVVTAAWSVFSVAIRTDDVISLEGARPVRRAAGELERINPAPIPLRAHAETPAVPPPLLRLENVRFSYPGRQVLNGVDLEIRPGELLALVGLNGAGKSTLTKLLAGLYRPDSGRILADGTDIAGIPDWQSRLSVVFQDFLKYPLSLRDNIALGAADPGLLSDVVRDAGLVPVVSRLSGGYDTPLSRSRTAGVDLSGGQWQQVALARALYATRRGARILVLDEPTAHLDVRTEHDLFQRLPDITEGISVVLISHRLSTVRQADRIVLLDGGRITESGTHEELMAEGGQYATMYALQAQRFSQGYDDRLDEGDLA